MDSRSNPTPRSGPRPEVLAFLELPGGQSLQGKVAKVDHHVVTVEFARATAPHLPIARQTIMSFTSADMDKPIAARSRVIFRRDEADKIVYEFQFSPLDGETLNAVFRRRTAARVKPTEVVAVTLKTGYQDTTPGNSAVLNDLSLTGMSIAIGSQGESQLCSASQVLVQFRLQGIEEPLEIVANLRYRRMAGTMIRYGLEFDPKSTREYGKQEERIAGYMVKRKIESVQQTLGTRAA